MIKISCHLTSAHSHEQMCTFELLRFNVCTFRCCISLIPNFKATHFFASEVALFF